MLVSNFQLISNSIQQANRPTLHPLPFCIKCVPLRELVSPKEPLSSASPPVLKSKAWVDEETRIGIKSHRHQVKTSAAQSTDVPTRTLTTSIDRPATFVRFSTARMDNILLGQLRKGLNRHFRISVIENPVHHITRRI